MRLTTVLLAAFFSTTLACGGAISVEPGDGGAEGGADDGTETGEPDTMPPLPDAPGGCGWGACAPGFSCYDGCNNCYCDDSGNWACTGRWCEDTGPIPDVPAPSCPSSTPRPGDPCPGSIECSYANSCGGVDYAYCKYAGGAWNVAVGACPPKPCPASLPKEGAACAGPAKCEYPKPCGTADLAYCDSGSSRWKIYWSDCPPPPPPPPPPPASCPTAPPKSGTACSGFVSCGWNNGCGGVTEGYCDGGSWWLSDSGCVSGCPSAKPASGASCKPPSSTMCTYVTPSAPSGYCQSNCFCAEDYRWACIPGGCSSSGGGGGWADAGTPMPK